MNYPEKIKGDILKEMLSLLRDGVNAMSDKKEFLDNVKSALALSESEQKKADEGKAYIFQADTLKREMKSREENVQQKLSASAQTLTEANNVKAENEANRVRQEKIKVELEKREKEVLAVENKHKLERMELDGIRSAHEERIRKIGVKEKILSDKESALNDRAEKIKQAVG
jgi:hypothetical protein